MNTLRNSPRSPEGKTAKAGFFGVVESENKSPFRSPREQDQANRSKSELKNITVFGRHNRHVPVYTKFEASPYTKVHSNERMQAVEVGDSLVDPHQTMVSYTDPLYKDPGYEELDKRDTRAHDLKSKVIHDYQGRLMVKVDEKYGMKNGGLFGQSTFNAESTPGRSGKGIAEHRGSALHSAGTSMMSPAAGSSKSKATLKELQDQKLAIMEKILQNDRQANDIISEKLNVLSPRQRFEQEVKRIDGQGPNLDSRPNVLGTAWALHQTNGRM